MNPIRKKLAVLLLIVCLTQSGCSLIALPFQLAGKILDTAWKIAQVIPKPPPGVF